MCGGSLFVLGFLVTLPDPSETTTCGSARASLPQLVVGLAGKGQPRYGHRFFSHWQRKRFMGCGSVSFSGYLRRNFFLVNVFTRSIRPATSGNIKLFFATLSSLLQIVTKRVSGMYVIANKSLDRNYTGFSGVVATHAIL